MLAALLLNQPAAFPSGAPPPKPRPAIKVKYVWPPLNDGAGVELVITRQEEISRERVALKKSKARAKSTVSAERIQRLKSLELAQIARDAIEADDEDALALVLLLME